METTKRIIDVNNKNVSQPLQTNSLHVEHDFLHIKPYDCLDISTENDSFYYFPSKRNVVTKLSLATEEFYQIEYEKVLARERQEYNKTGCRAYRQSVFSVLRKPAYFSKLRSAPRYLSIFCGYARPCPAPSMVTKLLYLEAHTSKSLSLI